MPSKRVAVAALGVGVLVGVVAALTFVVLMRDELPPGRGDLIAYSCSEPGNDWFAVCVAGVDGGEGRRLTKGVPASDPSWSPDGRRIVFTRHRVIGEYSRFEDDDIFVMDSDGDGLGQLTDNPDGLTSGLAAWSPDGRRIAFVRGSGVPTAGARLGSIYVMNAHGTDVRRVTAGPQDTDPSWSPDGRQLAFARAGGLPFTAEIHVVSASGGPSRAITRVAPDVASGPSWSPDGSTIAYVRTTLTTAQDGNARIYLVNRDGTAARLLGAYRYYDRFPGRATWSPDGRAIAVATSPHFDCTAILLLEVATGERRPLTSCAAKAQWADSPSWQPVGD